MKHRIAIARSEYKFSCAHMTVFADGTKERLHGHNYTLAVELEVDGVELDTMVPFAPIKQALADLCATWKEHLLLAERNRFFAIVRDDTELEFTLCGARYVVPRGEAILLPIENISVEALAMHAAELLRDALGPTPNASELTVTVEESPGQGGSCELPLPR